MKKRLEAGDLRLAPEPAAPETRAEVQSSATSLKPQASSLIVEDLRKSFRGPAGEVVEVLRGVSFAAREGEALALVGASGAGKSTLLNVVGGLEEADGGSVRVGGFDVTRAGAARLAEFRRGAVGFVFQSHRLLADLSAEENVALPLLVARRGRGEALRAAREMLAAVGLAERAAHAAGELSGGEQQRVGLARALVTRPRLVLADEPTGNLDARTGEEVAALLLALARAAGACVLVATHNVLLARMCDRVLTLGEGRVSEEQDRDRQDSQD